MIVASWFLQKKDTHTDRDLPKKRHGNARFIIQRFGEELLNKVNFPEILLKLH